LSLKFPRAFSSSNKCRVAVTTAVAALSLAGFAGGSLASVTTSTSGWQWGNPTPQGQTLSSIRFSGNRGYAIGEGGTALRTDDGGSTWSGVITGLTTNLSILRLIDSEKVVVGGGCSLYRSNDGGSTFSRLPWTSSDISCGSELQSFSFPTSDSGYLMLKEGSVLRTTNGGTSWSGRTKVPGGESVRDVLFLSDTTGIAISGNDIYKTTDSAGSWTKIRETGGELTSLYFDTFDGQLTGFALSTNGSVWKTLDQGDTWEKAGSSGSHLTGIACASASICLASVSDSAAVLRSEDGGANWTAISPSSTKVNSVGFAAGSRAVVVGPGGFTATSDDLGGNWSTTQANIGSEFSNIKAVSSQVAFALGTTDGVMAKTVDGGKSWTRVSVPTPSGIEDASFIDQNSGYVVDSNGSLYKTTDSGDSWTVLDPGTGARPSRTLALDSSTVLIIAEGGVLRSTNGGTSFTRISLSNELKRQPAEELTASSGKVYISSSQYIAVSKDKGAKFKRLVKFKKGINNLNFTSAKTGYLVANSGILYTSKNGGKKWSPVTSVGVTIAGIVSMSWSGLNGYITTDGNGVLGPNSSNPFVYHSADGGKTWRPQLIDVTASGDYVVSAAGSSAFVTPFESNSNLFFTDSGGDVGATSKLTLSVAKKKLSRKQLRRQNGVVKVSGKLSPADGGELVSVSILYGSDWVSKEATVSSNGTFTTSWQVSKKSKRTYYFVAQWLGNADHRADGSKALAVQVK